MNEQLIKAVNIVSELNDLIAMYGIDVVKHALNYIDGFPGNPAVKSYRFYNSAGQDWFLNDQEFNRVKVAWADGQGKISAIKEFRYITSCGLKEAKDAIEAYFQPNTDTRW